jgi:hypothetical protein
MSTMPGPPAGPNPPRMVIVRTLTSEMEIETREVRR